jgi:hypothetical protein
MASAQISTRRSTRASHPPLTLADEQALSALSHDEQRGVAAALRLSLMSGWESDDDADDARSDAASEHSGDDEKEEHKDEDAMEEDAEWSSELHDVVAPPPRLRHERAAVQHLDATPLELLQLFLPPSLMNEFARHTNAAAPQDWAHTTASELYAFIGVHLFMGIDRLPRTELYWSAAWGHPRIMAAFTRDRFKQLLRFFRVAALDDDAADGDPQPHVRSLAERLNRAFAAHYTPSQHLALDEAMVAYKGRSPIKQYIPTKPHKWGYKIWCLASDDYLLHFEVYGGREAAGATVDTVLRMTAAYQNQQHVLFTDNWFTSPTLMEALAHRGIRLCGSVRSNRKGMPAIPEAAVRSLGRGEWLQRQKGDATVAVWHDQKTLWVLYNHCSPLEAASLDRWGEHGQRVSVGCPRAVRDYFYHARSVDVLSQLHYAYPIGRKARRCWPRLAWWLLDMCIVNAFTLWSMGQVRASQLDFREQLMYELLAQMPQRDARAPLNPATALAKDHFPAHSDLKRDCVVCSHEPDRRVQSRVVCHACNVHLCIGDCFARHHS